MFGSSGGKTAGSAPANEPEKIFGEDTARWAQEILPRIKEVYHGEVIWKGRRIIIMSIQYLRLQKTVAVFFILSSV